MSVTRRIFRVLGWIATVPVILLLVCNMYIIGARHIGGVDHPTVFGWSWAVVISGSMEEAISVDDMVVIHAQDSYATGDIITFRSGSSLVTHRIIAQSGNSYTTKGDANNTEDVTPTMQRDVIGRVVLVIPKVGKLIEFLRTPWGMICLVLVGFALIEVPYLLERHKETKKGGSRDENHQQ